MVVLRPATFAKKPVNNMSAVFCSILLLVLLLPACATGDGCDGNDILILKPVKTYSQCDVKIHREKTALAPTIAYPKIENATSFNLTTILMLSPKGRNSVHWMKVDIPKAQLVAGISSRDNDTVPYKGPKPQKDTGEFTYQFYLLSQPYGGNVSIKPYVDDYEKNFKMAEFKSAYGMEEIGYFQYRTEYAFNNGGQISVSVLLGLFYLVLGVSLGY